MQSSVELSTKHKKKPSVRDGFNSIHVKMSYAKAGIRNT